ncbi:histidine phosphatase family protein [Arenibacterium sp. CAU 1754]
MAYPDLLILRHGETEWNLEGRLQGGLDSPLTERGREQARRQGEILVQLGVSGRTILSSPQGRALKTAQIACAGLDIVTDDRLREIEMGDWAGLTRHEIATQVPHLFESDGLGWYDHAPNGEGLIALERRLVTFLQDLSGPAVIVTHGITSRVLRCIAQGLPVEAFDELGGGQGNIYQITNGESKMHG